MSSYSSLSRVLSPFRVQTKFEENFPTLSTDIMLGCIVLGEENAFPVDFVTEKTIGHLKGAIKEQAGLAEPAHKLILWRVNIPENEKHEIYEGIDIKEKFRGEKLDSDLKTIEQVFKEQPLSEHIHIIVELPATTDPFQQGITQETKEEVLIKAETYWTDLKDKLVKKFELKTFRVHNHIYEKNINASGIPAINNRPSFILHSLPNNPNHEGYLQEEMLTALLNNVMKDRWLFLLGTSGSGKTRSLYELLCKIFGIYLSLSAGNGSKNLGSQDMDGSIYELGQYLTNNPDKNTLYALKFTRAILLGRLFILNKLLDFHNQNYSHDFTPKQWLLMQLLPREISGEDFWVSISRVFRELKQEDQDQLINEFIKKFKTLVPGQENLPIAIDESQVAITKHEQCFSSTLPNGPLRPFFAILLRTVLNLSAGKLCLILSGTGMSFTDIKDHTASAIAKSGGATYKNFFSIHDGFYECDEMSKFIQHFLPLNDELIRATYNIFRGRRRFIVQFIESALLDSSSKSHSDMNEAVKNWQDRARSSIIESFMELCFPRLREKKEAWNKVKDIVILSMFSHRTKLVRGSGVSEMVQYGFAQVCSFKHLADLNTLQKDAITVQIAEPIPILAFREYIKEHHEEFETWLYQNLSSVHYNASCAGFLFEPCLTIPLAELFNSNSCKEHELFTNTDIKDIDRLDSLLSCKVTIRNFDDCNSTTLCSNGEINGNNLPTFLNNPNTAFFMPEKEAGPDLVCIVQFHTPNGIIEVPAFLQAKLVKNTPKSTAKNTTDPRCFYAHGSEDNQAELKDRLRGEVLGILKSKYCKADELSWIRFLVVFPAEAKMESKYIVRKSPPKRTVATNYNNLEANELFIVINPSIAEHFFSKFGHEVLKELKRIADDDELELESEENDELELERETKRTKTSD